jgi:hypothetical protein
MVETQTISRQTIISTTTTTCNQTMEEAKRIRCEQGEKNAIKINASTFELREYMFYICFKVIKKIFFRSFPMRSPHCDYEGFDTISKHILLSTRQCGW